MVVVARGVTCDDCRELHSQGVCAGRAHAYRCADGNRHHCRGTHPRRASGERHHRHGERDTHDLRHIDSRSNKRGAAPRVGATCPQRQRAGTSGAYAYDG